MSGRARPCASPSLGRALLSPLQGQTTQGRILHAFAGSHDGPVPLQPGDALYPAFRGASDGRVPLQPRTPAVPLDLIAGGLTAILSTTRRSAIAPIKKTKVNSSKKLSTYPNFRPKTRLVVQNMMRTEFISEIADRRVESRVTTSELLPRLSSSTY